jgi:hypothetical protein
MEPRAARATPDPPSLFIPHSFLELELVGVALPSGGNRQLAVELRPPGLHPDPTGCLFEQRAVEVGHLGQDPAIGSKIVALPVPAAAPVAAQPVPADPGHGRGRSRHGSEAAYFG